MKDYRPGGVSAASVSASGSSGPGTGLLFLREEQMRLAQELMLLAWRDMGRAVAPGLAEMGLGHAHHRALQILALRPGLPVSGLQEILGVTKQSLARTLSELQERGLLELEQGRKDRRQRLLRLTTAGRTAEARLFAAQRERLVTAYREAGGQAVDGFRRVMRGMLSEDSRTLLDETRNTPGRPTRPPTAPARGTSTGSPAGIPTGSTVGTPPASPSGSTGGSTGRSTGASGTTPTDRPMAGSTDRPKTGSTSAPTGRSPATPATRTADSTTTPTTGHVIRHETGKATRDGS